MATASNTRIDNLMVSAGGPVGSPGGTRCGDMDGDGTIAMNDALMAWNCAQGTAQCDLTCDIDGDGVCTMADTWGIYGRARNPDSQSVFACEAPSL
ncbi:MAG: hypothetical protein JRH19_24970 [Deltaproteobacteria bacterium]|nr:hypothetical protein [Deltaproteobacteria bacterium]